MEPTERYDPEDLEHLMLERRFDELLEEERAFALRHLTGRAEYDRMRSLLLHVREDRTEQGTLDAPPKVREHVLQAFREQQRPQWKIWLNSVGGFLLPERPAQYWRPALAFGMVAVLSSTGVEMWNSLQHKENKVLAEVKQEKQVPKSETSKQQNEIESTTELEGNAAPVSPVPSAPVAAERDKAKDALHFEQATADEVVTGRSIAAETAPTFQADHALAETAVARTPEIEDAKNLEDIASAPAARAISETRAQVDSNTRRAKEMANGDCTTKNQVATALAQPNVDALLGLLRAAW